MNGPSLTGGRERSTFAERIRLTTEGASRVGLLAEDLTAPVINQRHSLRDFYLRRFLAVSDVVALLIGFVTVSSVSGSVLLTSHGPWVLATVPGWLFLFNLYGLYAADARRISHTGADELPGIFHAMAIGASAMWLYFQAVGPGKIEFWPILMFASIVGGSMVVLRALIRHLSVRVLGPERVLFVGSGPTTGSLVERMRGRSSYALEPVGLITDETSSPTPCGLPLFGELDGTDIAAVIAEHRIDRIVVEVAGFSEESTLQMLRRCKQLSIKVSLLPAAFGVLGSSVAIDHVGGITLLGVNPPVLPRSSRALKRAMDACGALLMLVLFTPLLVLLALIVKLDSPGPALFRQERVGKGGRSFRIIKFRTMASDAEERRAELLLQSKDPSWLLLDEDPRITRVGRFLRRSSLDELPQLLNVLVGDMSLVGPRPLIAAENYRAGEWASSRLDLTPGMTGLWQVLGRTTIPFDEMVKLDYLYVTNWSLWGDVKLVLQTFPVVLARRGSN